ncbi:cyclase family protein [Phaeacidiphilus oryzae]|uniref:cyclase family protein n=1 Tax=Phaeacidiphilus oryzae TaxID=348818 RepID=UPI000689A29A|nr:cyclase family protein [Phaeacidiphilus oryzae]
MSPLTALLSALRSGQVELIDLTAPLTSTTPVLQLPDPFADTIPFRLEEISRYDERGPRWYWNDIHTGEHTGTHLDAPVHWISGRDGLDVSQVPLRSMVAPAVVLDMSERVAKDPDFLLTVDDVRAWQREHGDGHGDLELPDGGWLLYRTGWDVRSADQADFLNADAEGPHTPGIAPDCARWLAQETPLAGLGVETVGTDAGAAHGFTPPFPCHDFLLGAGKFGLTQLQNLGRLPVTGAVLVVAPLPIVGGSGSPARVLAMVDQTGEQTGEPTGGRTGGGDA